MTAPATLIENLLPQTLTLPQPMRGLLGPGQRVVVSADCESVRLAFGGEARMHGVRLSRVQGEADAFYSGSLAGAVAADTYTESFPAAPQWIVNHNLGYFPACVSVRTLGGNVIDVAIHHTSANQLVITFDAPVAGVVEAV